MKSELLHLPEVVTELRELVSTTRWLAQYLYRSERHQSEQIALLRGGWQNDVLLAGAAMIPPATAGTNGWWTRQFVVPFASVTISDPNGVGDLLIQTDAVAGDVYEMPGPSRWRVRQFDQKTVPLSGRSISIASASNTSGIVYVAFWAKAQPPS